MPACLVIGLPCTAVVPPVPPVVHRRPHTCDPPTDEARHLYERLYQQAAGREGGLGEETAVHLARALLDLAEDVSLAVVVCGRVRGSGKIYLMRYNL